MKGTKYLKYTLLLLSVVLVIAFFIFPHNTADKPIVDVYIIWAYILLVLGIVLAIVFQLASTFKSPKGIKRFLILLAGVVVLVGVSYLLAPGTPASTSKPVSESTLKLTDMALIITYFIFGASILAIIITSIVNAVRNR